MISYSKMFSVYDTISHAFHNMKTDQLMMFDFNFLKCLPLSVKKEKTFTCLYILLLHVLLEIHLLVSEIDMVNRWANGDHDGFC